MLSKWMFGIMILVSGYRFVGLAYLLSTDAGRLPTAVYCAAGAAVMLGLLLICKRIIFSFLKRRELALFYTVHAASVILNLFVMKAARPSEVSLADLLVIGSLFDILVSAAFVIAALRESHYVRIKTK